MSHISRRRFLVTGLTAGSALALGTGAYLFLSRLPIFVHPSLPGMREFGLGNNTSIRTVAWSPDGSAFAAGGSDAGHVVIWRTSDGQELTSLPIIRYAVAWSVAWSPQSRYFAVAWSGAGSTGSYVSIWKTPTQESASSWKHERDFPISGRFDVSPLVVAWSPDGTRLGVGDSGGGLQV